ncbi:MAG: UvrB/UvrC motif-containing protein [Defluviitaleaceae bacterium]|nr:UvrB/UvrC motif-containing protein [Defluviitaleaceae bacterium]
MLCEKCNINQATVHMQQIVNGEKTEMHLCQNCSLNIDAAASIDALFNGLLGSFLTGGNVEKSNPKIVINYKPCPRCGMTYDSFRNGGGKLGCAHCYKTFTHELNPILKNVQASVRHEGKFPQKSGRDLFKKREVVRLRGLMQKAIDDENFEEAAKLRDEVRLMEYVEHDENVENAEKIPETPVTEDNNESNLV